MVVVDELELAVIVVEQVLVDELVLVLVEVVLVVELDVDVEVVVVEAVVPEPVL